MPFPSIARFGRGLLYGFKRELRPYEAAVLEAALAASGPKDRAALQEQFDTRERIQRWTDRVLHFSLARGQDLPPIAARMENHCHAKVQLVSGAGEKVTAQLMTHRGLLSTLEFSKAPVAALAGGFRVAGVTLPAGGKGYADEIDEEEHGTDPHA